MAYKREPKTYKLIFEDPEFEGLEVRTKGVPLGEFLKVTTLVDIANGETSNAETMAAVRDLFAAFAEALISWNLEDDNGPVSADLDGIHSQDMDFVLALVRAWMEAIASVSAPLDGASASGGTSPMPPIPMETLSKSLTS